MATQTIQTLRNIYFISSRLHADASSHYTFVFLSAIDILSQAPVEAEVLLQNIRPVDLGSVSQHPLDRCHDLFFFNTAEHFTIIMSPKINQELLIPAVSPYLGLGSDPRLQTIFEAAHSVMLAILATPQSSEIVAAHIHPYSDTLFQVGAFTFGLQWPEFTHMWL